LFASSRLAAMLVRDAVMRKDATSSAVSSFLSAVSPSRAQRGEAAMEQVTHGVSVVR
jgi:hypothetical protein